MTKFLNLSNDSTFESNSPYIAVSEKAVKGAMNLKADKSDTYTKSQVYTKTEVDTIVENIVIESGLQPNLTSSNAGNGISITGSGENVVISNTQTSAEWGNVTGTLSNQTDLQNVLNAKANDSDVVKLTGTQAITGTKSIAPFYVLKENSDKEGGQIHFDSADNESNAGKNMWIDRFDGQFRFVGLDSNDVIRVPLMIDIQNNQVTGVTPATSDSSTKIATTAFVVNVLKAIYPVGAVYIGTTSTCPLASFFGTWTLKSSGIVTSVNTSVPVKGNGISFGLTDGTYFASPRMSSGGDGMVWATEIYGTPVGTSSTTTDRLTNKSIGVTNDASKSGIVGTVTRSTLSVNIWERTA